MIHYTVVFLCLLLQLFPDCQSVPVCSPQCSTSASCVQTGDITQSGVGYDFRTSGAPTSAMVDCSVVDCGRTMSPYAYDTDKFTSSGLSFSSMSLPDWPIYLTFRVKVDTVGEGDTIFLMEKGSEYFKLYYTGSSFQVFARGQTITRTLVSPISLGVWTHCMFSFESGSMAFFKNGVQQNLATAMDNSIFSTGLLNMVFFKRVSTSFRATVSDFTFLNAYFDYGANAYKRMDLVNGVSFPSNSAFGLTGIDVFDLVLPVTSCFCQTGFSGNGVTCTDVDECAGGTDNCDSVNAVCTDSTGSFTCSCNTGWESIDDGVACTDVDECAGGTDNCDSVNAVCTDSTGSFTCSCNTGWESIDDGVVCTDVDECSAGTDNCDANAVCTNTPGSFTCECKDGYYISSIKLGVKTCADINECLTGGTCPDSNSYCTNTDGSFTCACNSGYTGDGMTCAEVDECSAGTDNCDANAVCTNTVGSFTCVCPSGFTGNGLTCTDVDECAGSTDICDANAACTNTDGSFTCECNDGYYTSSIRLGVKTCADINECWTGGTCPDSNSYCINTDGSFACTCLSGYSGDGVTCTDVDECALGTDTCKDTSKCINTPGSFTCECKDGYYISSIKLGVITCADKNECLTGGTCPRICTNTDGSFVCSDCYPGFHLAGNPQSCVDINECALDTSGLLCGDHSTCVNEVGTYSCTCDTGFTGSPCVDISECDEDIHSCSGGTICSNTVGSFLCTCSSGYTWTGQQCVNDDECAQAINPCTGDHKTICNDTEGSFECECDDGWFEEASRGYCWDINECQLDTYDCPEGTRCENFPAGSYTCELLTDTDDPVDLDDVLEKLYRDRKSFSNALVANRLLLFALTVAVFVRI